MPDCTGKSGPETLDRSEALRRLLLDSAMDAMVSLDDKGVILDWNRRAEALFGWRASEAAGKPFPALVLAPTRRAAFDRELQSVLASGDAAVPNHRLEAVATRREGGEFPIELFVTAAPIDGGRVCTAWIRELPHGRDAGNPLLERCEQLKFILDSTPALVGYIGADLRYKFNNRAYEEWFGLQKSAITGKTMSEVLGPDAFAKLKPMVDAALAGTVQTFETGLRYSEGGPRYVRGHYFPHRTQDGEVLGFVVFIMDLSERRVMEEALLEKEAFLESIYNGAEECIFVVDIREDGEYVFRSFNPAYLRRSLDWGVDMGIFLGKTTRDLRSFFPEDLVSSVEAKYAECAASGGPIEFEDTVMVRGKPTYWITHLSALRDDSGRTYRLIGTSLDITRQKEAAAALRETEEQLRQSQKMDAIGRLAGGIAHDFNNLLTAINGYADLALVAADLAAAQEMAREIRSAGDRAAGLTSQLLAFSRKQILVPRVLDLNTVVAGMESLLRRVIGEQIELATFLDPGLRPIKVDAGQLEQIVLNLALNARDAMPGGGKLTLETYATDLGESPVGTVLEGRPGPQVVLAVSDTGTGMSEEVRKRLFEPFFTTKEAGKGTGMGLATVYGIVKQSGGRIHVYSEPGKGSSFKIYFPAADGTAAGPEPADKEGPALTRGRGELILLVEDDSAVRSYTRRVLENLDYRVEQAENGMDAIRKFSGLEGGVRLLLTDVIMPGMSGQALWERLKELQPDLQVLFMSGYTDNAIVHNGVLDENVPFLPKPFSPAQLALKIQERLAAAAPR